MKLIDKIQKIERMDLMIRRKGTGKPQEFAERMRIAESTLYEYLKLMKEMGAPINFCRGRNSYKYEFQTNFNFGFRAVDEEELRNMQGGVIKAVSFLTDLLGWEVKKRSPRINPITNLFNRS